MTNSINKARPEMVKAAEQFNKFSGYYNPVGLKLALNCMLLIIPIQSQFNSVQIVTVYLKHNNSMLTVIFRSFDVRE